MPSVAWKIKKKKLFSIIFQFFTYFLHWPHECSKFFFAERGQVQNLLYKCWTSGYFTEWFFRMLPRPRQPGSLDCGKELPELPWNPQVRIRWASWRAAEHSHPSSRLSLRSLHSLRLGTTQQWQQAEGGDLTSHTCTSARASQAESPGVLRWEAFQVQTHTVPSRMRRWRAPQWWVLVWPHWYSPFYQYYKAGGGGEALI